MAETKADMVAVTEAEGQRVAVAFIARWPVRRERNGLSKMEAETGGQQKTSSRLDCRRVKSDQSRLRCGREGRSAAAARGSAFSQSRPLPAATYISRCVNFGPVRRRDLTSGRPRQWRRDFRCLNGCDGHRRGAELRDGGDGVLNGGDSELNTSGSEAAPGGLPAANVGKALADRNQ
ncbi:v-type ATP synthase alpha chain [Striga asiatica]|uniref:V-type ATP synthase alpha chain n=1 Tax=Striga asiatica TaxID=4170 RepID=A0A5A7PKK1_STRAF|nr:v-type ATP synthase alpha chain [Striga asiatica]